MVLTKLAGISIFVTLSFRTLVIVGESVLTSEGDKGGEIKVSDKRVNNFGVPMEMPYDTNFWPSRGRRGRHPESDICYISDRNFVFIKRGLRCQTLKAEEDSGKRKWPLADTDMNSSEEAETRLLGGYSKMGSDCCEPLTEGSQGTFSKKVPDLLHISPLLSSKRSEELRNEHQKYFTLPRVLLYGNGVYWERENPYGEKKKKEDVFWVARGKKNFFSRK